MSASSWPPSTAASHKLAGSPGPTSNPRPEELQIQLPMRAVAAQSLGAVVEGRRGNRSVAPANTRAACELPFHFDPLLPAARRQLRTRFRRRRIDEVDSPCVENPIIAEDTRASKNTFEAFICFTPSISSSARPPARASRVPVLPAAQCSDLGVARLVGNRKIHRSCNEAVVMDLPVQRVRYSQIRTTFHRDPGTQRSP